SPAGPSISTSWPRSRCASLKASRSACSSYSRSSMSKSYTRGCACGFTLPHDHTRSYYPGLMLTQTQIDRQSALAAYRLGCFGAVQLHDAAGVDCTPRGRKTRAVLIYVLLARSEISRDRLAALLWADHGDEQARASVRQALYELKPLCTGSAPLLRIT